MYTVCSLGVSTEVERFQRDVIPSIVPAMVRASIFLASPLNPMAYEIMRESAYEVMRESGMLPTRCTLNDYTYWVSTQPGFSSEIDMYLKTEAKVDDLEDWQRLV